MLFFAARAKNGLAVNRQMQNILMPFTNTRAAYTSILHAGWLASGTKWGSKLQSSWKPMSFHIRVWAQTQEKKKFWSWADSQRADSQKLEVYSPGGPGIHMCDLRQAAIFGFTLPAWKTEREILSPSQRGWMCVRHLVRRGGSCANNQNKVWDFDTISLQS